MEGRGIEQDIIPYMVRLELSNVPIEGWIFDSDIYGLLDGPCDVVHLPTHYGKVIYTGVMTCVVSMIVDGGRDPKMFPLHLPTGPCRLTYVFLTTVYSVTLVPIDYSASLCDIVPVLGSQLEVPDCLTFLEIDLDFHIAQMFLKLLLKPLG